jgi:hypothetical protein
MHFAAILLQNQPDAAQIQHLAMAFLAILPIILLVGLAIVIVPFWFILKKAGFSPWLSLLNAIPLGNLILLYVLAFSEWKVGPLPPTWPVQPPYPPTYPPQV